MEEKVIVVHDGTKIQTAQWQNGEISVFGSSSVIADTKPNALWLAEMLGLEGLEKIENL